ncbi:hypothetical protein PSTG_16514 [Puccinia striiformis f. sp. tritici PST-78]|uniref:pectin lyase n=1 Tax=Puccinia striiformis f. sp. tritici PST-78 TaxID=1165861 RepID=A0A0L0USK8_9BASI|nr:hypothetical protein PSTG_16514 [Puccinia striiformis f. sp. tritici PST-78]
MAVTSPSVIFLCLLVSSIVLVNAAFVSTNTSTTGHEMYVRSPQAPTMNPNQPGTNGKKPSSPGTGPRVMEGGRMEGGKMEGGSTTPRNPQGNGKAVPFGFGSKATGGGKATPQTPRDTAELLAWLTDKVPRVILISKTYDFTVAARNVTAAACRPWAACSNGAQVQLARNANNWCSSEKKLPSNIQVSLHSHALDAIKVSSQKTLLGVGANAVLKGKGLALNKVQNVIIQVCDCFLTSSSYYISQPVPAFNYNSQVWGGDAIMFNGAKDIWIDHCTFSHIGRQMLASGGSSSAEGNAGITISNNLFSGKTKWSVKCNDKHYWNALFSGPNDSITMARNCIDSTSGRNPKTGGSGNPKVLLHYYNNLHTNIIGETFQVGRGSDVLAEGNVYKNVKTQNNNDAKTQLGGRSFVPLKPEDANRCTAALGRPCVPNLMLQSSNYLFGLDAQALTTFRQLKDFYE